MHSESRQMTFVVGAVVFFLLVSTQMVGFSQPEADEALLNADNLRMQPEEVLNLSNGQGQVRFQQIFSAPSRPGMYVQRVLFEAGTSSRPHYHDQARWVTVIQGTWWTGEGDVFDEGAMIPIREGGIMYHPAGFHHYDGAKDEDVIVQIMGMGPVETVSIEVDEHGNPIPR